MLESINISNTHQSKRLVVISGRNHFTVESTTTKYSTFPLSSFSIKDSRGEKIPIGASSGPDHLTTTTGLFYVFESPRKDFLGHSYAGHFEW